MGKMLRRLAVYVSLGLFFILSEPQYGACYVNNSLKVNVVHEQIFDLLSHGKPYSLFQDSTPQISGLYHPLVNLCLERYLKPHEKSSFQKNLDRLWLYESNMKSIFRAVGVPDDLIFLSLVESGVRIHAKSVAGAAGLWQLMPSTARSLGLRVNGTVDERLDPIKSTWAVAKYLKKLYDYFKSWPLVLAAYNMGENGLKARMQRFKVFNFFDLAKKRLIPKQTRYYVPKVLAAIRIGRTPAVYGFSLEGKLRVFAVETVPATGSLSLYSLSKKLGIDFITMLKLNPAIKDPYTPIPKYTLVHIPWSTKDKFYRLLKPTLAYGENK